MEGPVGLGIDRAQIATGVHRLHAQCRLDAVEAQSWIIRTKLDLRLGP